MDPVVVPLEPHVRLRHLPTKTLLACPFGSASEAVLFAHHHLADIASDLQPEPCAGAGEINRQIDRAALEMLEVEPHHGGLACVGCDEWIPVTERFRHIESCTPLRGLAAELLNVPLPAEVA
jgi:hypothetical protein